MDIRALVSANDLKAVALACRDGSLSSLPQELKGELPRLAARLGLADMLRLLCERCAAVVIAPDDTGRSILHEAAVSGDPDTVRFACERLGLDPTQGDRAGVTALDLAANAEVRAYLISVCGFSPEEGYRNPVRRGFSPDPSAVRVGSDYYLVNSSFVQFPGLPISHSTDLVHWKTVGHAVEDLPSSGLSGLPGGYGYWAPDISWDGEQFWVIATLRRDKAPFRLQLLTHAKRPEGPWSRPVFLDIDGIDPSLFTDEDGRRYVVVNPGAQLVEIDREGNLLGQPEMLYYGTDRRKSEGPHLLKKDGWYYLFQAEGGTGAGHMETVSRSRNLRGPYAPCPFNPILGRKDAHCPIGRSGHGKPIMTQDGRWYMLYLCGRDVDGKTVLGRETALDPMTWTADGWPMVNDLKGPSCLQRLPFPAGVPALTSPQPDPPGRMSPRSDPDSFAEAIPGGWRLRAGADLGSIGPVSALLWRQQEPEMSQQAVLETGSLAENSLAGLVCYYDELTWLLLGIHRDRLGLQAVVISQVGNERTKHATRRVPDGPHTLRMQAGLLRRTLSVDGVTLAALEAPFLSDEGAKGPKRFTGTLNGLAAIGSGWADFTGFREELV